MSKPITDAEKRLITYHLGYPTPDSFVQVGLGVPAPLQVQFLLQGQLDRIPPELYGKVRKLLCRLEAIEDAMGESLSELSSAKVGETTLRTGKAGETVTDLQEALYTKFAQRLADLLGVPLYPYSKRFSGKRTGSVPVTP